MATKQQIKHFANHMLPRREWGSRTYSFPHNCGTGLYAGAILQKVNLQFWSASGNPWNRLAELAAEDLAEHREHLLVQCAIVGKQVSEDATLCWRPRISLTAPPASVTSRVPAAMSQGLSPNSQKKSSRPQATYARSMAADPVRRTPCDAMASWW